MGLRQLRLVASEQGATNGPVPGDDAQTRSPAERVFSHWVFMMGKRPGRVAFGPGRRKVVERALALYPEEVVLLAVDGCAASPWHAGENDRATVYTDLELILRDEQHIERFAELGERVHERAARQQAAACAQPGADAAPAPDPAQVAAHKERIRRLTAQLSGRSLPPVVK